MVMSALSKIKALYRKHSESRIVQGDILRDITFLEWDLNERNPTKSPVIDKYLPYIVILTQDCDLEQDFDNRQEDEAEKQDKFLQSILVCPAYIEDQFRKGTHLEGFKLVMENFNSERFKIIRGNNNPRYHFLQKAPDPDYQIPNLVLDFKHYYTMPVPVLYKLYRRHYVASLNELFREALSQRFSYYLSRVGLPIETPNGFCELSTN